MENFLMVSFKCYDQFQTIIYNYLIIHRLTAYAGYLNIGPWLNADPLHPFIFISVTWTINKKKIKYFF
jgi:hypothetical protein